MSPSSRRIMGYLCTYVPEEIIHAAGFTPVRIFPTSAPAARADAHLQSYTCSYARGCLERALAGDFAQYAGVVFAHSCDTMQGLSDIWHDEFTGHFVNTVVSPIALTSPHAKTYLVSELHRFADALEKFNGPIQTETLRASIRLYNQRRRMLARFYAQRTDYTAVQWFETITTFLTSASEDWTLPPPSNQGVNKPRLLVVGSTIDEPSLPQIIDNLDALIVADDLCTGARYFDTLADEEGDPFEAIANRMLTRLPCPCKHQTLDTRVQHLVALVQKEKVNGVIFYQHKFCDPHAWDYVPLAAAFDQIKLPHLLLEVEQSAPVGQMQVRVEAFLEMLAER